MSEYAYVGVVVPQADGTFYLPIKLGTVSGIYTLELKTYKNETFSGEFVYEYLPEHDLRLEDVIGDDVNTITSNKIVKAYAKTLSQSCTVVLGIYRNGNLINVAMNSASIGLVSTSTITLPEDISGVTIKVLLWDSATNMSPKSDPIFIE